MTGSNGDSNDTESTDSPVWLQKLLAVWEWAAGVFHGHAGTQRLKNRER